MKTAVVLAGGHGMRLWPLTERFPKPMVAIDDRPILEFVVGSLRASGVERLLVILQFNPAPIVQHFRDGRDFGISIDYLLQEGDLGTAGSVRQAAELLSDEQFLVVSSDILFHGDLLAAEEFHHSRESACTLALSRVEDPSEFGTVTVGSRGRIVGFQEKPRPGTAASRVVNAGIYFLRRSILDEVPRDGPFDFGRQLFPAPLRKGARLDGWTLPGYWRDIGTFQGLAAARRDVREIPEFKNMETRWPASSSGDGGRIWVLKKSPAWEWLEMDAATIGKAAGLIWKYLSAHGSRLSTLTELQKIKGIGANDAAAAVGWLAREGKLEFKQEGRVTKVKLVSSELQAVR
jgi:NDP-sugar pyrophosphorylase family protein